MGDLKDKLRFRQATYEDYEGVLDINRNVYSGFDYLPSMYRIFLQDSKSCTTLLTLEDNGKIVAFGNGISVYEGRAILHMAGRSHTDFLRRGLTSFRRLEAMKLWGKKFPMAKQLLWTTNQTPKYTKMIKNDKDFVNNILVHRWHSLTYPTAWSKLESILQDQGLLQSLEKEMREVREMSPSEAMKFLADTRTLRLLFHGKPVIGFTYGHPFQPILSDIRHLVKQSILVGSFDQQGQLTAISFQNGLKHPPQPQMHCFFYGSESGMVKQCMAHYILHLRIAQKTRPDFDDIGVGLHFPLNIEARIIKDIFEPKLCAQSIFEEDIVILCQRPLQSNL